MSHIAPIHGLVIRWKLSTSDREPCEAGFVKATGTRVLPVLWWPTKPKAFFAGFFAFQPPTRVTRVSLKGLNGLASSRTPAPRHPWGNAEAAFSSGTAPRLGDMVEQDPNRLNDGLMGLWVAGQDSTAGRGQEAHTFHPCPAYGEQE